MKQDRVFFIVSYTVKWNTDVYLWMAVSQIYTRIACSGIRCKHMFVYVVLM